MGTGGVNTNFGTYGLDFDSGTDDVGGEGRNVAGTDNPTTDNGFIFRPLPVYNEGSGFFGEDGGNGNESFDYINVTRDLESGDTKQIWSGSGSDESYRFDRSEYDKRGSGTVEEDFGEPVEETRDIFNRETTETRVTTQPFSSQEIENGKAYLEQLKTLEEHPLDENQTSYFFPEGQDGETDTTHLGQLGRIVGSPDPETGDFRGSLDAETGEFDNAANFRAGEVFVAGVVPGGDPIGSATSGADEHLSMELQNGNIGVDDFIELANDEAFLSRNEGARADYIRERYTDQGVDNIENGREATNGEDNVYTSRDNLLFKVPDAAGDPDDGPIEPYFVMADGTPIPDTLQDQADGEGMNGGMSPRTIDGIAVLGGTAGLTDEQQAVADVVVADYIEKSGDTELDQDQVTSEFLGRVQNEVLGDDAYANVTVENTMPDTVTPFISDGWRGTLFNEIVNGPDGLLANSEFIDGDTVTDPDGLWNEIQAKMPNSPQAQQFVYESITGSLYDTSTSDIGQYPVVDQNGDVVITAERVQFLDLVAEDAVRQMANPDRREELTDAVVTEKLQQSVTDGELTQVEVDHIEGQIDQLQIMGPDEPVVRHWNQGATPFLSDEQKAGYADDIAALTRLDEHPAHGENTWRVAIDREFPDASPQLKNFLHSEATGEAYFENQYELMFDRDDALMYGIDPTNHMEQKEAEAVIEEGIFILQNDPEKNSYLDLYPEIKQAELDGDLTPGQVGFIMSSLMPYSNFGGFGGDGYETRPLGNVDGTGN